jgi:hypothetical protein
MDPNHSGARLIKYQEGSYFADMGEPSPESNPFYNPQRSIELQDPPPAPRPRPQHHAPPGGRVRDSLRQGQGQVGAWNQQWEMVTPPPASHTAVSLGASLSSFQVTPPIRHLHAAVTAEGKLVPTVTHTISIPPRRPARSTIHPLLMNFVSCISLYRLA